MPPREMTRLLLQKADQDLYVLDILVSDGQAPIEVFGFHAQQAVEKLIKAVLALNKITYGRTHRLGELVDLATDNGLAVPDYVELLVDLTPYAVEFHYDIAPDEGGDELDKHRTLEAIKALRGWIMEEMDSTPPDTVGP